MSTTDTVRNVFPTLDEIPTEVRLVPLHQRDYLLDGELKTWDGPLDEIRSPICIRDGARLRQEVIGSVPSFGEAEAMAALRAAAAAYDNGKGQWPTMAVEERIHCVQRFASAMKERRDEVVRLLMWEIGKSLDDSRKEFDRTLDYIRDTVSALKELDRTSSRFSVEQGVIAQIRRSPLGVVLCMGPFNYPLNETFTTLIPALIMGNTVLFKPAKYGILLVRPLLEAFRDSFPRGVVNTVYGAGATVITPIMASGQVDVLAFIGSSRTANVIEKHHPKPNRLKSVLGLGAKNPAIVLRDADLDLAVRECVLGALSFNGQRCTALKVLFVERPIADEFARRFAAAVNELVPGMPWTPGVRITPLPEDGKTAWLSSFIEDAVSHGARVVNEGGGAVNETFLFPAVLYPVSKDAKIYRHEQFGPVVPIVPFDRLEEPVEYVETSPYGQQAAIFSSDPVAVARLIDPLVNQVSRLNLNCQCQRGPDVFPFTGRKDSAEGTLSVSDALRVFSIRTLVAAKQGEVNTALINDIVRNRRSNFLSTDFIL